MQVGRSSDQRFRSDFAALTGQSINVELNLDLIVEEK